MPAAMFHSGSLISPRSGFLDCTSLYVLDMSCMMPRAPTQLLAWGSRLLAAIAWALNRRQSKAGPKNRLEYFLKVSSYRSVTTDCACTGVADAHAASARITTHAKRLT